MYSSVVVCSSSNSIVEFLSLNQLDIEKNITMNTEPNFCDCLCSVLMSRRNKRKRKRMAEKLTDIELTGIILEETKPRTLGGDPSSVLLQEDDIETGRGTLRVAVQGDRSKAAIITYHDIGLNHVTNFQGFFSYGDMQPILRHFCVYHINAPGQHDGALPLMQRQEIGDPKAPVTEPHDDPAMPLVKGADKRYHFPSMDELSEMILPVLQFYGIKHFIGFGMGAGANILTRFALNHPEKVDALALVNCTASVSGWTEWGWQKLNTWYLKSGSMTGFTEDYLLWHWFGQKTVDQNYDLVRMYRDTMKHINPHNLALFIESYTKRTALAVHRDLPKLGVKSTPGKNTGARALDCDVLLMAGDNSPHLDAMVDMNSRIDPSKTSWMKISDCGGMPLEEAPEKVCDAFRLFLQGLGYVPFMSQTKIMESRSAASRASLLGAGGGGRGSITGTTHQTPVVQEQEAEC
ncbi:protein NDRG3 isoform X14 [Lingula anatina]|uniref:Protein NDRG3 isoform X13 n=1 Tax=Lingula anatina TaxID=7574 RepID=A0A1S3J074_LINAN|nr:protein NDRG3 isoform X13 [Lingula anatina]XP_013403852.1 protein NDRG3 isoform X14 [Lingula anatina]|eukprot:XP_013403851.1 protein NDRG3 isoform X13 [Lingula anatina]